MTYRAVFDGKGLRAEFDGEVCLFFRDDGPDMASDLPRPMVVRDIEPYRSMADGSMITSRSEHRDHLKRHNCFEIGNETKALMETKPAPPKTTRREKLTRYINETMSDKTANKILKDLRKG